MATAASTAVSATLLLAGRLAPRRPLGPWAERKREQLSRALGSVRDVRRFAREVGEVANQAALIAAHRGDAGSARRICEAQGRWQERMARRARAPEVACNAAQAWVNLARVEALAGDWRGAAARLARLEPEDGGAGCVPAGAEAAAFGGFLRAARVVDTLRALLMNARFAEALDVADGAGPADGLAGVVEEARLAAMCGAGEARRAARRAADDARAARGWEGAVFRLRLAESAACAGDAGPAREALSPLVRALHGLSPGARSGLLALGVAVRAAALCRETGLPDEACLLARGVVEGARAADDEVFRIEALRVLAACAPGGRARWARALARAERATEYARYRSGGPPPPCPVFDALDARLDALLA